MPVKNITMVHGWNDDIVPYQNSVNFAQQHKVKLVLIDVGHRLSDSGLVLNNELEERLNGFGFPRYIV